MESLFRGVYLQVPCVDTFLPRTQVKIKWDFTQEELERGKAMIAKAASTYVKGRMGGDVLGIAQVKCRVGLFPIPHK